MGQSSPLRCKSGKRCGSKEIWNEPHICTSSDVFLDTFNEGTSDCLQSKRRGANEISLKLETN